VLRPAFAGSDAGGRLFEKVALRTVQAVVAVTMIGAGIGLAAGLIRPSR